MSVARVGQSSSLVSDRVLPHYGTLVSLHGADLLSVTQLAPGLILDLFRAAAAGKADPRSIRSALDNKAVILLFEKPSLRTKISFEVGVAKMGGHALYMDHSEKRLGERESVRDYGKNLERWVDCIVARVYSQTVLEELADAASCPVINALSDRYHPCQALADLFTLYERAGRDAAKLREYQIAYVGDGNNVCHSLMHCATLLGVGMHIVTPKGYGPAPDVVVECEVFAKNAGSSLVVTHDLAAVEGSHAVYTDVWVSMGQAGGVDEATKRRKIFSKYQVNAELMARAGKGLPSPALFMHCLPAQRGVEVTDEVIDSPNSIVYDQAENRMHAQNALLCAMFPR